MTFEEWSKPCVHKNIINNILCDGQHPIYVRVCNVNNCPRAEEFAADIEATEYEMYLEDKMQLKQEKAL